MVAREEKGPANKAATFELERFAWGAPDRLELSGSFVGLPAPPADAPVLVVRGAERTHRLPPAADSAIGTPEDGQPWRAEFAWQEVPEVFDVAQLQLGGEIVVDLPAPGEAQPQSLEVRHARSEDDAGAAQPSQVATPATGAERLRLESELLAAREAAGELRVDAERAREELARARADLESERERRAADAERFRDGLARVQESAEGALSEAGDAIRTRDAALEELRAELDLAAAARTEAESAAADAEALRDRVDGLESARSDAEEARADAERLLARLTTIRDALGDRG